MGGVSRILKQTNKQTKTPSSSKDWQVQGLFKHNFILNYCCVNKHNVVYLIRVPRTKMR